MSSSGHTNQLTAVVLVGGLGTRIQSLYPNIPKPMIPVLGKPFVEWVLRYLRSQFIHRAILSSGYRAEVVGKHFAKQRIDGMEIRCVSEPKPLGTAGGFLNAVAVSNQIGLRPAEERLAGQPIWLVLNGDSLVFADMAPAIELIQKPDVEAVVVGIEVPDTSRYGKLRFDCTGQLLHFGEKEPGKGVINAGIYFFKESVLAQFPSAREGQLSFEKDVFPALLNKQTNIQVCVVSGPFLDIGTPESVTKADAFIKANLNAFSS
jgi:D-glycero-alpha-D-manno-heptose 1-phosphate guanylyltransferase